MSATAAISPQRACHYRVYPGNPLRNTHGGMDCRDKPGNDALHLDDGALAMTSMGYLAIIEKTPESCFGVVFPDVPGCYSAGDTLGEARAMAHEALALHLEGAHALPGRRSLRAILDDPEFAEILENAVEISEISVVMAEAAE